MAKSILWFKQIYKDDVGIVGEKGANLGEMVNAGLPVPDGFIVTSTAYFHFLHQNKLINKINQLLSTINYEKPESLLQVSEHIKKLVMQTKFYEEFASEIDSAYRKLNGAFHNFPVNISLNEQKFDNIHGEANVMQAIKKCWASLFEAKELLSYHEKSFDYFYANAAVIIQKKIIAEKTGLLFTQDPTSINKSKIVIETDFSLTKDQADDLMKLGEKIKKHFFFPQEIAWIFLKNKFYIIDTKPLTPAHFTQEESIETGLNRQIILRGLPVSPGIATGRVKLVKKLGDLERIYRGDILVTKETDSFYLSAIKKSSAIVTEKGGRTSHAALTARTLGKPAVTNIKDLSLLNERMVITVNGTKGEIYKNTGSAKAFSTATKIYTLLSNPFNIEERHKDADSVIYQTVPFKDGYFKDQIKKLSSVQKNRKSLLLMLPPARTLAELIQIKHFMESVGIVRSANCKFLLTIAAPSNFFLLEDFITAGIDGVIIDVDDLTKNILAGLFDATDPSVLHVIKQVIISTQKHHLISSIFGESLSLHSSLIEKVVRFGIASISVKPNEIDVMRQKIAKFERRLIGLD